MEYTIYDIPYQYDRDLFYINKETYNMMFNDDYYFQPIEIEFVEDNYVIPELWLSKKMIEKGMYYCTNQEAKDWMQSYIDKWIEQGEW